MTSDLFEDDPVSHPLTYPGPVPDHSGLVAGARFHRLRPITGTGVAEWRVAEDRESAPVALADALAPHGLDMGRSCFPVLAVGSNASPAQMRRKFVERGVPAVFPMVLTEVQAIAPGVSAHISRAGYIPAAPIVTGAAVSRLFVLFLNEEQLRALDATEPNYQRCVLPAARFPVRLPNGDPLASPYVYVSDHGCLVDGEERALALGDQRTLIRELLGKSPGLRRLCGEDPAAFVASVRDPALRASACALLHDEGWTREQPELRGTAAM
ncbi:hypothetical protein [Allosalinactinospora lopnorensis]|uniref:hypothetical protein n=1 Tax=Allosalinactinospora lopnorensis TaxID=1352348 RepID=UPI000623D247|nr:hypothetical protein [Allosalinactinospora lopnorensis]